MAEFEADVAASETNYRFRLLDRSGEELSSNLGDGESLLSAVDHIGYASFVPGAYAAEGLDSYVYYARYYGWTQQTNQEASAREDAAKNGEDADGQYILEYGVAAEPQIDDSFYRLRQEITRAQGQFVFRVGVGAALLLAALASLICLLCLSAGEGCVPTWQEKIYLEVYLLGAGAVDILLTAAAGMACQAAAMGEIWSERAEMQWQADLVIAGGAAAFAGAMLCTALLLRTLAVRLHTGTLGRTSLLCRGWSAVYRGVGEMVRQLPLTWRTIAGFFVYLLANVLSVAMGYGGGLLVILVNGAALVLLCRWTASFARLRRGSRAIAAGDLNYRVDTARMPADLRAYAEDLNNISIGLAGAVDEKMKSERFKAELITNVSLHYKLCESAEDHPADRPQGGGVYRGAGPQVPAAEKTHRGPGGGQQGIHRRAQRQPGEDRYVPAAGPGPGGVDGETGGAEADGGDHRARGGDLGLCRRAAPVAGHRQPAVQLRQIRHGGHPHLCGALPGEGPGDPVGEERLSGGAERPSGAADGALCPGGGVPQQRGLRPGAVHRPQPHRAAGGRVPAHCGRGPF